MTIDAIREQLKSASRPIAKSFHVGEHFKVLVFGFNKGMKLEEHTAHHPTKLLVLEGEFMYHQRKKDIRLKQYDEVDIPAEVPHSLTALQDAFFILTQG